MDKPELAMSMHSSNTFLCLCRPSYEPLEALCYWPVRLSAHMYMLHRGVFLLSTVSCGTEFLLGAAVPCDSCMMLCCMYRNAPDALRCIVQDAWHCKSVSSAVGRRVKNACRWRWVTIAVITWRESSASANYAGSYPDVTFRLMAALRSTISSSLLCSYDGRRWFVLKRRNIPGTSLSSG